jgi:hypothetical protein
VSNLSKLLARLAASLVLAALAATGLAAADASPARPASAVVADTADVSDLLIANPTLPAGVRHRMPRTLIITDSTGAYIRWESANAPTYQQFDVLNQGGSWEFRGESCRAVSIDSCRGREGYGPPNVLDELATLTPGSIDELTVMAGYNEGAEILNGGIQQVLDLARAKGIAHVTWLNFCTCSEYVGPAFMGNTPDSYGTRNAYLMGRAEQSNGYLSVVDWGSINDADPSLTIYDRSHLTATGAVTVAHLMAQSIVNIWLGQASSPVADLAHPQTPAGDGRFTGTTPPIRLIDTRQGTDGSGVPQYVAGGEAIRVVVPVVEATAAIVNVTTVDPLRPGYLTAYPCTSTVPTASFSNFGVGAAVANTTTVKLDADGGFCLFASTTVHLVVDLYGTLGAVGAGFVPSEPTRIFDTRSSRRPTGGVVAIPVGATSLHGNVTIANGKVPGFATVWPGSGGGVCPDRPNTSLVNWSSPAAVANRVDIGLPAGEVCVAVSAAADIIVDAFGHYDASGSPVEVTAPTRLFDSRATGTRSTFSIPTNSDRPTITINLVTIGAAAGFTTIWSAPVCGVAPNTSLANQAQGIAKANSVQLPNNGQLCVRASTPIDLILDLD